MFNNKGRNSSFHDTSSGTTHLFLRHYGNQQTMEDMCSETVAAGHHSLCLHADTTLLFSSSKVVVGQHKWQHHNLRNPIIIRNMAESLFYHHIKHLSVAENILLLHLDKTKTHSIMASFMSARSTDCNGFVMFLPCI